MGLNWKAAVDRFFMVGILLACLVAVLGAIVGIRSAGDELGFTYQLSAWMTSIISLVVAVGLALLWWIVKGLWKK